MSWWRDRWVTTCVGLTAVIVLVSAAIGFAWLPREQPGQQFRGWWDAICSAAGLIRAVPSADQVVQASYPVTQVERTPQLLPSAGAESIGRGATLALRCAMCHGARGLSQADTPNLAGQYAAVVYKELMDFKTGARISAVMQPLVADLGDGDMRDLAAYYAYLPREPADHASADATPRIVAVGAPMRNIAPCGACHGELSATVGAPWLDGQPAVYLHAQLLAFTSGTRHNDIDEQMRNVARGMTPDEIESATRYFANRP